MKTSVAASTEQKSIVLSKALLRAAEALRSKASNSEGNHPKHAQSRKHKTQESWSGELGNERQKRNQHKTTEPCGIKLKTTATIICPCGFHF